MSIELQTAVTLLLISWAVLYVGWRAWITFFRKPAGGCGGCAKCPAEKQTPTNLISVESLLRSDRIKS